MMITGVLLNKHPTGKIHIYDPFLDKSADLDDPPPEYKTGEFPELWAVDVSTENGPIEVVIGWSWPLWFDRLIGTDAKWSVEIDEKGYGNFKLLDMERLKDTA